jgi:uracil-DNA glycosylase family 4
MHDIVQQLKFFSDLGVTHLDVETVRQGPTLEEVRQELGDCQRCKLHSGRTHLVFGVGDPAAELMFVGEAPGADEDAQGIPFVGRAGQLLTKIIEAIDLTREQVYITNILKCRPPGNRDPEPDEVEACEPFLFQQIEAVQPKIIVALGKYAAQNLLRTKTPISKMRGEFVQFQNRWLLPTFHPSYLLRNPSAKRQVWEDMQKVRDRLKQLTR